MSAPDLSETSYSMRLRSRLRHDGARTAAVIARRLASWSESELHDEGRPSVARDYGRLYEAHAQSESYDAVGGGDYDVVGAIEFDALRAEGLRFDSTLVDFGCGTGRLARHALPFLTSGRYLGIDIAPSFLARARQSLAATEATSSCQVEWIHQAETEFATTVRAVDLFCAFSVFTHMEHEDTLRYLRAIRPLMKPTGRLVLSCLPISLVAAQEVLEAEATLGLEIRWSRVRNVVTSVELMEAVARLAGWTVCRWYPGDQPAVPSSTGELRSLGQSILVLTPTS
jgi:SAM-dependent methyltransferase